MFLLLLYKKNRHSLFERTAISMPELLNLQRLSIMTALLCFIFVVTVSASSYASPSKQAEELYHKAKRLMEMRDYSTAEDLLQKALEIDTHYAEAYMELALAQYYMHRFTEGIRNADTALSLNHRFHRAYYIKALIKAKQYHLDDALSLIEEALNISPENFVYHKLMGVLLLRKDKYLNAKTSFEKALDFNPLDVSTRAYYAQCLWKLGEKDEALIEIEKAFKDDPKNYDVLLIKGIFLSDGGDLNSAYTLFQNAIRLMPDEPSAYYNSALIDLKQNRKGQGEYYLLKAMELDKFNPLPYLALGVFYRNEKLYEESMRMLNKAYELNPDYSQVHLELGVLWLTMNNFANAASALEKGVLAAPDNGRLRNALGSAYRALGKYNEALTEYYRALALDPQLYEVYYNLANLFEERDMIQEAEENLSLYLQHISDPSEIEEINNRLKILEESKRLKQSSK